MLNSKITHHPTPSHQSSVLLIYFPAKADKEGGFIWETSGCFLKQVDCHWRKVSKQSKLLPFSRTCKCVSSYLGTSLYLLMLPGCGATQLWVLNEPFGWHGPVIAGQCTPWPRGYRSSCRGHLARHRVRVSGLTCGPTVSAERAWDERDRDSLKGSVTMETVVGKERDGLIKYTSHCLQAPQLHFCSWMSVQANTCRYAVDVWKRMWWWQAVLRVSN